MATLVTHATFHFRRCIVAGGCIYTRGLLRFNGQHLMILSIDAICLTLVNDTPLVQQVVTILEGDDLLLLERTIFVVFWARIRHRLGTTIHRSISHSFRLRHIWRAKLRICLRLQLINAACVTCLSRITTLAIQYDLTVVHRCIDRFFTR